MRKLILIAMLASVVTALSCNDNSITGGGKQNFQSPSIFVESHVDVPPRFIDYIQPEYPRLARQAGLEGTVTILALVDHTGMVSQLAVAKPSGTPSLDDAAIRTAGVMRYYPAMVNHRSVDVWIRYDVEFRLPTT